MITLIKWLIKCFFKSELETYKNQYLKESRKILEDTEKGILKKYIKFDHVNINTSAFLAGMSPLYNNNNVYSWLLGHQEQCNKITRYAMAEGKDQKALRGAAQSSLIDDMLADLQRFEFQYLEYIEQKKLKGEQNNA